MFRKPKKKPATLRSNTTNEPEASTHSRRCSDFAQEGSHHTSSSLSSTAVNASSGKKRIRQHRYGDSSSDDENDDDDGEDTNELLNQIRQERESKSNKKQVVNINTSSTSARKRSNDVMHQYKTNNDRLSAKEMATRGAEHHPAEKQSDNNTNSAATTINQSLPSLQSNVPRSKFLAGPLKAPTFVRTTARFDYQPDICKDYKETGFCGFGDTCIYLHDRGDTKSGWEMEREYEERKKKEEEKKGREVERFMSEMGVCGVVVGKSEDGGFGADEKDRALWLVEDGIPFACHLCRGPFKSPIVTTCGHYFCEGCMLSRIREVEGGVACPICQKDTHGVLNHAQKLVAKKRKLVGRDATWEEYLEKSKRSGGGD
eukprot:g14908.t1 g14908   contig21:130592-131707(-)